MRNPCCTIALFACVLVALLGASSSFAQLRAFPGAEGYGALASGGRGGEVYIVTNRNDSGAGSFREAFNYSGTTPRTIVFETSGIINLDSRLTLNTKSNITIAGHTAPGGGVLIRGDALSINNCNNIIIRHMRFRYENADADRDAVSISASTNMILDHVSTSWGRDECLSLTNAVNNITVQHCIIAEATRVDHQYGSLINSTAPNGRITLWRNLYVNNAGRTPRAASQTGEDFVLDFRNNVIYNWGVEGDWGSESCVSENERATWNMVNNLYIAGPDTTKNFFEDLLNRYSSTILRGGSGNDSAYLAGNQVDSDRDGVLDPVAASWSNTQGTITQLSAARPIDSWAELSNVQSPADALAGVLSNAGCTPWNRDSVDARFIEELESYGTDGNIRTSIPSFPTIATGTAPVDTDRDGMPDSWESWYGTDPAVKSQNEIAPNQYTALENYLQWIIAPGSVSPLPVEEGEGITEGVAEGGAEGVVEGVVEGVAEGGVEGGVEGNQEGLVDGEGTTEGAAEGEGVVDGEGISEGAGEGQVEGNGEGEGGNEYPCEGNLLADAGFELGDIDAKWGEGRIGLPANMLHADGAFGLPVAEGNYALRFYPRVTADILRVGQSLEMPAGLAMQLTLQVLLSSSAAGSVSVSLDGQQVDSIALSSLQVMPDYQAVEIPLPAQEEGGTHVLSLTNGSLSGGGVLIDAICLTAIDTREGTIEGMVEGEGLAEGEGISEGALEGALEGNPEGGMEGEGAVEGRIDGGLDGEGVVEEGALEGGEDGEGGPEGRGEGEGAQEGDGQGEGIAEGMVEGETSAAQSADINGDFRINLGELLRLIQLYNAGHFACDVSGEDGYAPGVGDIDCTPHQSDYAPRDWAISLGELLRLIQFYNFGSYFPCDGEGGFCPGEPG